MALDRDRPQRQKPGSGGGAARRGGSRLVGRDWNVIGGKPRRSLLVWPVGEIF